MTGVAAALRRPGSLIRWARPAGHALTAAAAVFLCLSLWSLFQSGRGADHDLAAARDEVSRTAVRDLALINSIDPKVAELDLQHWLDVATGPFADALKRDMPAARARFAKQTARSHGRVTALAVTGLDRSARRGDRHRLRPGLHRAGRATPPRAPNSANATRSGCGGSAGRGRSAR
ncbi:hypothetical protein LUX57_39330 [Actinomadura madurae]|uniref:hypothetical protein n=1 Tax=Actinomadura madurae TaxID=1993 RepID=UPI0020D25915|nr:hypothetical protein [Actinomadura madurae]MCP9970488.1 hypothetical protein [Actinomadura madurae]